MGEGEESEHRGQQRPPFPKPRPRGPGNLASVEPREGTGCPGGGDRLGAHRSPDPAFSRFPSGMISMPVAPEAPLARSLTHHPSPCEDPSPFLHPVSPPCIAPGSSLQHLFLKTHTGDHQAPISFPQRVVLLAWISPPASPVASPPRPTSRPIFPLPVSRGCQSDYA